MIAGRGIISRIKKAEEKIKKLGGVFAGESIFKDIIFSKGKEDLRLRVLSKNHWATKNVILVKKQVRWKNKGKEDKITLKKEFDSKQDGLNFIEENFSGFKRKFEFSRVSREYKLGKCRIFIEDVEKLGPTVEIEVGNENKLRELFDELEVKKILKKSMLEIMKELS